jgi:ABC-type oligopeptide transport system substrate-binding subunit
MNQHICNLLALVLAAISACAIAPCQAQTPTDSNSENNNLVQATDNTVPSQLSDSATSNNSKSTVISESDNNTQVTSTKPNPRIPISSRIFAVPSMQQ